MPAARLAAIAPLPVIGFGEYHEPIFPIEIFLGNRFWAFRLLGFLHFSDKNKKPCTDNSEQGQYSCSGLTTP